MTFLLSPKFFCLKHCFIELSKQLEYYSYEHVALVEWSKGRAYFWVTFRLIPLDICRLDKSFSNNLGLIQESKLYVSFPNVYFPDCIRIFMVPNSIEDWEILEPERHKLSTMLLTQQRILSKDLTMPFWLHSNVCIYLRILDIYPFSDYVILQPNSELNLFSHSIHFDKFIKQHEYTFPIGKQLGLFDDFIPSELFGGFVDYITFISRELFSHNFKNESLLNRAHDTTLEDNESIAVFFSKLFNNQNISGCLLNSCQFRTDGYTLYLKKFAAIFPQNVCQTLLFNSQFQVFVNALLIATPFDFIHSSHNSYKYIPTRIFSKSLTLHDDLLCKCNSFHGENISESTCLLVYPSTLRHSKISKASLQISQKVYFSIGELDVILAFKEFISALSIESPLPVLCNHTFLLQREHISFWVTLTLECVENIHLQSYCILDASILRGIPIHVTPCTSLEMQCTYHNKPLEHGISRGEKYFFGYQELKTKANRIIDSFLSSLNQLNDHLALLVTSDSNIPQIGRKSFVKYMLHLVKKIDSTIIINSVDGFFLKGKKFGIIEKSLFPLFNQQKSSIAVIYNFEHLISEHSKLKFKSDTSDTVCQYIFSELNRQRCWKRKLIFFATSRCIEHLHKSMVSHQGRHLFQHTLRILRPNDQERADILRNYIDLFSNVFAEIDTDLIANKFPSIHPCNFLPLIQKSIQSSILNDICIIDHKLLSKQFSDYALLSLGAPEIGATDRVKGIEEVKSQIFDVLKLQLNYPRLISMLPVKIKVGLLLYGMPGTGKTCLVESLACENVINIIKIRGPEILEKYVGASEERIRDIFSSARNRTPCLIFFDEFDSIARCRGSERTGVLDRVVNQLLTELDGVREIEGISVIATTCHPELIDPALLRTGRLGMHIECTLPSDKERLRIMESLVSEIGFKLSLGEEAGKFVEQTIGFTRADIKAIITNLNDLKQRKCFDNSKFIFHKDLMEALRITVPSLSKFDKKNYELNYQFFRIPDCSSNSMGTKVTCA